MMKGDLGYVGIKMEIMLRVKAEDIPKAMDRAAGVVQIHPNEWTQPLSANSRLTVVTKRNAKKWKVSDGHK